jgi:nitroreductase
VINDIVRCGLSAPSSKNAQPWRLHVVRSSTTLKDLADAVQNAKNASTYVPVDPVTGQPRPDWQSTVAESAEVLRQVSLGIFVENRGEFSHGRSTLSSVPRANLAAALVGYTFEIIGVGAAVQNMWIAAESMGLRGVFMGDIVIAEQHIAKCLQLHGDLVGVLALGYSDGEPWIERMFEPDRLVWH